MFKVSKWPYQSSRHDQIICRWWNFELNNPGWKLSIGTTLIAISRYLGAKFDYSYFIIFLRYGSKILHKKFQVILIKNEGVMAIFPNFHFILNWENQRHAFIFAQNDSKFFV